MTRARVTLLLTLLVSLLVTLVAGRAQAQERRYTFRFGKANLFGNLPVLMTTVPGWALTGSRPEAYQVRCDEIFTECTVPILRTRSDVSEPYGMGSLTHSEAAKKWRGMRVQLRAELKAGRIGGWSGLWMRVDGPEGRVLAFDNMQNRPLRGTSSYAWYTVVLDVPLDAERLSFGVLLHGPGAVFVKSIDFEPVNDSVPTTDLVGPLRAHESR